MPFDGSRRLAPFTSRIHVDGTLVVEGALRQVLFVDLHVARDGVVQMFAGAQADSIEHLGDTAVEALDLVRSPDA